MRESWLCKVKLYKIPIHRDPLSAHPISILTHPLRPNDVTHPKIDRRRFIFYVIFGDGYIIGLDISLRAQENERRKLGAN